MWWFYCSGTNIAVASEEAQWEAPRAPKLPGTLWTPRMSLFGPFEPVAFSCLPKENSLEPSGRPEGLSSKFCQPLLRWGGALGLPGVVTKSQAPGSGLFHPRGRAAGSYGAGPHGGRCHCDPAQRGAAAVLICLESWRFPALLLLGFLGLQLV